MEFLRDGVTNLTMPNPQIADSSNPRFLEYANPPSPSFVLIHRRYKVQKGRIGFCSKFSKKVD